MDGLTVALPFPVTVLAGSNGCGKSTVLFAAACAYAAPSGKSNYYPSSLFPCFRPTDHALPSDTLGVVEIDYDYSESGVASRMRWGKHSNWSRSFFGQKAGSQPRRDVYLRTLANLTNPAEVRSVLQIGRDDDLRTTSIDPAVVAFALRILPGEYETLNLVMGKGRDLLFAARRDEGGARYSEFHMSSGERAVLRLANAIASLRNALVLIDEVDSGLHPFTQQHLMLELQWLAIRNDLQIIVATHSPVVLDCVPLEGRVFLDRRDGNVRVLPPHRDVMQRALYGRSRDQISILCEDEVAEAILRGVFDELIPELQLAPTSVDIGRDTGASEFASHARALAKFQDLDRFVFVLDGDERARAADVQGAARAATGDATVLHLPGGRPEEWIWSMLQASTTDYEKRFGLEPGALQRNLVQFERVFAGIGGRPAEIAKQRLRALCDSLSRSTTEVCRIVGRAEASGMDVEMRSLVEDLRRSVESWRRRQS